MRTIIFDLDGTLADTSADLAEAANACFRALGHGDVLDLEADAGLALHGARAMLREGFARLGTGGPEDVEREYPKFIRYYASNLHVHSRLYPGVEAVLDGLRTDGYRLAICTNKPFTQAEALVRSLGIGHLFGALIGADTLPTRKPDPAPMHEAVRLAGGDSARAVMVGDTANDRAAARNAVMPCILVTFGPNGDQMAGLEPEATIGHFGELPEVVVRLIG